MRKIKLVVNGSEQGRYNSKKIAAHVGVERRKTAGVLRIALKNNDANTIFSRPKDFARIIIIGQNVVENAKRKVLWRFFGPTTYMLDNAGQTSRNFRKTGVKNENQTANLVVDHIPNPNLALNLRMEAR